MKVIIKSIKELACICLILVGVLALFSCDNTISNRNGTKQDNTTVGKNDENSETPPVIEPEENPEEEEEQEKDYSKETDYTIEAKNGSTKRVNRKLTPEKENELKKLIANSAEKIIEYYPLTFGYLKGKEIGIGLIDYENNSAFEAAAINSEITGHKSFLTPDNPIYGTAELSYAIGVNTSFIINMNDNTASIIAHETMHALMFEALSAGMTGRGADLEPRPMIFPSWFIEGTAVTVGGGKEFVNNVLILAPKIEREIEQEKDPDTLLPPAETKNVEQVGEDIEYIKKALNIISLKDGRVSNTQNDEISAAVYGTGYLALAYLSQLIADKEQGSESEDIDVAKIRHGLDLLMSYIAKGYSMDLAIKKLTKEKYTSVDNFEDSSLDELAEYSIKFFKAIKEGFGSTITENLNDENILAVINEDMPDNPTLVLNPDYTRMTNFYPQWLVVFKGGGETNNGYAFNGTYPNDVAKPPFEPINPNVSVKAVEVE